MNTTTMSALNYDLFYQQSRLSADGYFIFQVEKLTFSYLNSSFGKIFNLDNERILAHPGLILTCVHEDDREHALSCYQECLEDGREKKYELRLLIGKKERFVRVVVSPIPNENGTDLIGTVEDVTIMRQNKIHLEQINARKNITLEVLAHDLKEPLGMIKLAASSIEHGLNGTINPEVSQSIAFIKDMCERNLLLVRSMINHEFLKSAEIEIAKERADMVWELRDVVRFYKRSKLREERKFIFTASTDPIYLELDSMKFLQVINNLISNAIKFTQENGEIKIHVEELPASVLVTVSDNGIGIPEHLQEGLFDRLPQTLRPGLMGQESGGFGMGIIRSIVNLHQGKIWFESQVGVGTTFYIELPK